MTDELDLRRRRAAYRAAHRGTKEMDALVGRYAEARLAHCEGAALDRFERFLEIGDPTLQSWIFDPRAIDQNEFRDLVIDIRAYHGLTTEPEATPSHGR
jgi:antitoxin CptB